MADFQWPKYYHQMCGLPFPGTEKFWDASQDQISLTHIHRNADILTFGANMFLVPRVDIIDLVILIACKLESTR